jgi:hypothetical protein
MGYITEILVKEKDEKIVLFHFSRGQIFLFWVLYLDNFFVELSECVFLTKLRSHSLSSSRSVFTVIESWSQS